LREEREWLRRMELVESPQSRGQVALGAQSEAQVALGAQLEEREVEAAVLRG